MFVEATESAIGLSNEQDAQGWGELTDDIFRGSLNLIGVEVRVYNVDLPHRTLPADATGPLTLE